MNAGRPRKEFPEGWEFWLGVIPDSELAPLLGCSNSCLRGRRHEAGIPISRMHTTEDALTRLLADERVRELVLQHQSLHTVARIMGVSHQRIQQIAERAGLKSRRVWSA